MFGINLPQTEREIIEEFYNRSTENKKNEAWMKQNKSKILEIMKRLDKKKLDVGDIRVNVSIPDTSKFDEEAVLTFLESKGLTDMATKKVLDEDKLFGLINEGVIDVEELKGAAWKEMKGTPRLIINKVKNA